LEGIVVQLYKETSGTYDLIRTSETDSRGWYEFNYLDGGDYGTGINYYVDVAEGSLPTGYSQTQITTQNRSNPPPDGDRFIVNLEPGDAYRQAKPRDMALLAVAGELDYAGHGWVLLGEAAAPALTES
jgi:hypothetical protein